MAQIVFPVLFLAWSVYYLYFIIYKVSYIILSVSYLNIIIYKGDQENKQDRAEGDVWLPEH